MFKSLKAHCAPFDAMGDVLVVLRRLISFATPREGRCMGFNCCEPKHEVASTAHCPRHSLDVGWHTYGHGWFHRGVTGGLRGRG